MKVELKKKKVCDSALVNAILELKILFPMQGAGWGWRMACAGF